MTTRDPAGSAVVAAVGQATQDVAAILRAAILRAVPEAEEAATDLLVAAVVEAGAGVAAMAALHPELLRTILLVHQGSVPQAGEVGVLQATARVAEVWHGAEPLVEAAGAATTVVAGVARLLRASTTMTTEPMMRATEARRSTAGRTLTTGESLYIGVGQLII